VSDDGPIRDTGLAAERTELAWGRSSLALFACGAAIARGIPRVTGNQGRPLLGALILALGGMAWLAGVPYARTQRQAGSDRSVVSAWAIGWFAGGTAIVGIAALVIVLFFPT